MRGRKSLIAGLVCGLACVGAILLYAQELDAAVEAERAEVLARYGGEQVEVYVATRDIAVGETVSLANAEKQLWVGELLPEEAVFDLAEVEGKTLASPVYAGEVVLQRRFETGESSALQVPDGLCAVSVSAKPVSAVGGSVRAGSTVDVYATSGIATDLLASQVLVLATSATTSEGEEDSTDVSWVTLAVEPDLVEELIAAAQKTELYFVLPSDTIDTSQLTYDEDVHGEEGLDEDAQDAVDVSDAVDSSDEDAFADASDEVSDEDETDTTGETYADADESWSAGT